MKTADPAQRHAAEMLHDPAARAQLFNAFPALVWCADGRGQCTFVNQAWEDYTGLALEHAMGDGWLQCVHEEDRPGIERQCAEAFGFRKQIATEYRLRRGDGSYGWVQHAATPVNDEHGRLAGYLGTCHDITERRDAELLALSREAEIRTLADNVPVLIAYFEAEGQRCIFANKAYASMWGLDERSIIGRNVREIIGEEGHQEIGPHIERVFRGESVTYERTIVDKAGNRHILEVNLRPQREDAQGRTTAAFVLIHDITRHRVAEQKVRESEERLRKFADATRAGIVFHDNGVVTDVNDAVLQLVGYTREHLIGSQIIQYVAPEHREEALRNVRDGYERPYESEILHKDGTRIPVEFEGRLMPFGGTMHRLSVVRDIRRRRASQARIDFLAHHDPLTSLPNRALLRDRLEFVLSSAPRRIFSATTKAPAKSVSGNSTRNSSPP